MFEAWKGMLDGNSFLKAGWVHGLKLHQYKAVSTLRFVVMGKVSLIIKNLLLVILNYKGETFTKNVRNSPSTMDYS